MFLSIELSEGFRYGSNPIKLFKDQVCGGINKRFRDVGLKQDLNKIVVRLTQDFGSNGTC